MTIASSQLAPRLAAIMLQADARTVPVSMFLKSPACSDKPKPNRSQKGAFTNKLAPKIKKFVPKDEGEEGAEEGDASKAKPGDKVPDSAFVTWLRDKETSHAVHVDMAKDYLLEGAPFKGDSTFDAKDAIKDLGGTWRRNPDKAKDCDDKSIRRGWWSAPNESVLLKLLRLGNDERGRRQWTPLGMGDTQMHFIMSWLDEFYGHSPGTSARAQEQDSADPTEEDLLHTKRARTDTPQESKWYVTKWVENTVCISCRQEVWDQFMDCSCAGAIWKQCPLCCAKYRVDFKTRSDVVCNLNAWCMCRKGQGVR